MSRLLTIDKQEVNVACIACAISSKELKVFGDMITETKHFHAAHDIECPIPGMIIIGSKRHVRSVAEFGPSERADLTDVIHDIRTAMQYKLEIKNVTIVQEEGSENSHFHLWLFPWHDWMKKIGTRLPAIPDIMKQATLEHHTDENKARENLAMIQDWSDKLRTYFDSVE